MRYENYLKSRYRPILVKIDTWFLFTLDFCVSLKKSQIIIDNENISQFLKNNLLISSQKLILLKINIIWEQLLLISE